MSGGSISRRARHLAWMNAALLMVASWVMVAGIALRPRPDTEVFAMVFPLWWDSRQAMLAAASADAAIVRVSAIPAVLIVRPSASVGLSKLQHAGSWLALDPRAIAACL